MRAYIHRGALIAGLAAVALLLGACGNTIDSADLEEKLRTDLAADVGVDPADVAVDCPEGEEAEQGNEFECTLTAPNGDEVTVEVTITDDGGAFEAVVPRQQFEPGEGDTGAE
jgi:hypothetical protein